MLMLVRTENVPRQNFRGRVARRIRFGNGVRFEAGEGRKTEFIEALIELPDGISQARAEKKVEYVRAALLAEGIHTAVAVEGFQYHETLFCSGVLPPEELPLFQRLAGEISRRILKEYPCGLAAVHADRYSADVAVAVGIISQSARQIALFIKSGAEECTEQLYLERGVAALTAKSAVSAADFHLVFDETDAVVQFQRGAAVLQLCKTLATPPYCVEISAELLPPERFRVKGYSQTAISAALFNGGACPVPEIEIRRRLHG